MTLMALALLVVAASVSTAADYPMSGEFLHLRSRGGIRLGAIGDMRQVMDASIDPRITGAALEMAGDGIPADAPPIPLPAEKWRALGDPPGSRGFRYYDAFSGSGVRKVSLRFGTRMALSVGGGGHGWPYRLSSKPNAVTVLLHVGEETLCASFGTFRRGRSGAMRASHAPPPSSCSYDD